MTEKIFVPGNRILITFGMSAMFAVMLWAGTLVELKISKKSALIKQKQFIESEIKNQNLTEIEGIYK